MISDAIILSAGRGSRLLPITATRPKCLVEVGGRTLLAHQLAALASAGISRALVVTGYRHDQIEAAIAQSPQPLEIEVRFNPFWAVASSIGSVWTARDRLERPFLLLNGDTLFDAAIVQAAVARAGEGVSLVIERITAPAHDDMLVRAKDGKVLAVGKTLDPAEIEHRSLGLVLSSGGTAYREALDAVIAEEYGAGAFHHGVIDRMAETGTVHAIERVPGVWQEIDQPHDIEAWYGLHDNRDA